MKKIICLLLMLVLSCGFLVSCSDEITAEDLPEYKQKYNPEERKPLELDFYIIVGEGTQSNAMTTVQFHINEYLRDTLNTTLDIHYLTEAEYSAAVGADVFATGEQRADIVLVAGKEMFDSLYAANALANLTDFYRGEKFGKLNADITETLLAGTAVTEIAKDKDGNDYFVDRYYTVPNDRVIGEYEYIVINRQVATHQLNYSPSAIAGMTTYESTEGLRADIANKLNLDPASSVLYLTGKYEDKAYYEANGYYCNIAKYPTVTKEEAFMSGFAIVRAEDDLSYLNTSDVPAGTTPAYLAHYDRCMEVIYAINTDVTFRNLLLYGVAGSNHELVRNADGDVEKVILETSVESNNIYRMNMIHTGDVFKAYYCDEYGWNETVARNGEAQNKQSVVLK